MALWVKTSTVRVLRGRLESWTRVAPSGRKMLCQFCPTCGTRIFHQTVGQEGVLSIKPGTLNDTKWLRPVAHVWSEQAQPWVEAEADCLQFPGNPDDFGSLISAWQLKKQSGGMQKPNDSLEPTA